MAPRDPTLPPGLLEINQPEYPQQLGRVLGTQAYIPGRFDPLVSLGIQLDDYTRPEYWHARRGKLLAIGISIPALAGNLSFAFLQGAEGMLTVVERVEIFNRNAALQSVAIGFQVAAPAAGGAGARGQNRDARDGFGSGIPTPTLFNGGNNAAPTVPSVYARALIGAGQLYVNDQPWVVEGAGCFLTFVNDLTVNQSLDVQLYFRERVQLETEV